MPIFSFQSIGIKLIDTYNQRKAPLDSSSVAVLHSVFPGGVDVW